MQQNMSLCKSIEKHRRTPGHFAQRHLGVYVKDFPRPRGGGSRTLSNLRQNIANEYT